MLSLPPCSSLVNCFNANTLSIFRIFFAYLMRQNAVFLFLANFSKTLNSKKSGIIVSKVAA